VRTPVALADADRSESQWGCWRAELDRVIGGGLVAGSVRCWRRARHRQVDHELRPLSAMGRRGSAGSPRCARISRAGGLRADRLAVPPPT